VITSGLFPNLIIENQAYYFITPERYTIIQINWLFIHYGLVSKNGRASIKKTASIIKRLPQNHFSGK
jgi:hypothetical protein